MNAQDLAAAAKKLFKDQNPAELLLKLAGIVFTAALILLAFSIIRYSLGKFLKGKISARRVLTVRKAARYTGFAIALLYIFKSAGIDITAILGAAGVAGIVLGFAAQTSVSSLISGFFLMSEKPFTRGDTVKVGDITGIVLSADFLSVKLKTLDNLFVRIPNETLIKSNLINVTRFPIRRLDLSFDVAYKEDLEKVEALLRGLAASSPLCLDNPAPFFGIDKFASSGVTLLFYVWAEKSKYWELKNALMIRIKKCFEEEAIEIPYQTIDININEE